MSGNPSNVVVTNGGLYVKDGCKFGIKIPEDSILYTDASGLNITSGPIVPAEVGNGLQIINNDLTLKTKAPFYVDETGLNLKLYTSGCLHVDSANTLVLQPGPGLKNTGSTGSLVPNFLASVYGQTITLRNDSDSGFAITTTGGDPSISYSLPAGFRANHFTSLFIEAASTDGTSTLNDSCRFQGEWSAGADREYYGFLNFTSTGEDYVVPETGVSSVRSGFSTCKNTTGSPITNTLKIFNTVAPSSENVLIVGYDVLVFVVLSPIGT